MGEVLVRVENVVFDYGDTRALDHVSLTIERGTITALVGPNGAGKTTLLRCLAALNAPLEGRILIEGDDVIAKPRSAHRRLGFLQDFFGVYDGLTVLQNLRYAAAIQGLAADAIDAAARGAAASVALSDRLGQRAEGLSRGLRQRLAIARAIVHMPTLLLLDEPASGLDPEARHDLSRLMNDLNHNGMTIVVSSHILAELEDYATQMLTMRAGRAKGPVPVALGTDGRRRFYLTVLGDPGAAQQILRSNVDISRIEDADDGLSFDWAGDKEGQYELLKSLLNSGVRITSMAPTASRLEDMYLREKSE
jgi:ABC-2 type transport system ATP-binding protein